LQRRDRGRNAAEARRNRRLAAGLLLLLLLLLGPGRRDDSGDFTKGAGLASADAERIIGQLGAAQGASSNADTLSQLQTGFADPLYQQGLEELASIAQLVEAAGYGERIRIDPAVVRGLEYYTGPVFEAELTFAIVGEDGAAMRFGSVGGGGRYDGLVERFRGESVPATGFSLGVSRLLAALAVIKSPVIAAAKQRGPVVVVVLDRDEMARYQELAARLRAAGIAAEAYLGSGGMNAQLKYADRRGSVCAVIQGSNEREAHGGPQVMIRDLVLGAALAGQSKARADYVELRQTAQFAVPEAKLVEAVAFVLAKHEA